MDYGIKLDHIPIKCDNTSAINLSKNPIQHSRSSSFDLVSYSDTDFAGSLLDRKSTFGTCQVLGQYLVSWFSKK